MDKTTLSELLVQVRRIEEHRQKGAEKRIKQCYESLLKDLREFLGVQYAKFAEDDVLTYAILQQKGEYAQFLAEIEKKVNQITPKAATEIRRVVNDVYELAYSGMVKAVTGADTVGALHKALQGLPLISPEVVKRAVENPISGLTLKDTLEKNRKEIVYNIKREIGTGLTQGDQMSTMAKRIQSQIDMDYRKAMTIARTEVHRVREAGHCDSAKDISAALDNGKSGMAMVKIWRTMQDESVRPQKQPYKRKSGVKARKKATAGLRSSLGGANHVKMEGVTVKADELFNLGGGVHADAPGGSGVAGHDINCRCFVEYDLLTVAEFEKATGKKYEKPLTSEASSGMMERVGDTDGRTQITDIQDIDFSDESAVNLALDNFDSNYKDSLTEAAMIISPLGKRYELHGTRFNVNTRLIGENSRKGSISIHNHPNTDGMADCFSSDDFVEHFHDKAAVSWLISNGVRYKMSYDGDWLSEDEARDLYQQAKASLFEKAMNGFSFDLEQLEIMRELKRMLKGLEFNEF